ncbi:sphingomyelin phosphodiesterase-like [Amphiura filiformis]|uniref:sphingomyelin phosphodiesterase-like n=1 Tax=Amphiura filiformis TaxID=82378 RepID=UPI003B21CA97
MKIIMRILVISALLLGVAVNHIEGRPWDTYSQNANDINNVIEKHKFSDVTLNLSCDLCKLLVGMIDDLIDANRTEEEVVVIATQFCITFKIESERVCTLVTKEFKDELFGTLVGHYISPAEICGSILGDSCAVPYDPASNWTVKLPDTKKPPVVEPTPPKAGSPELKVLHLSDIHWDRMYQEGANAVCGEPLCCRSNDGKPTDPANAAGKWGDYRDCDTPKIVIDNLMQHLAQNEKIDFVYVTGDLPAHNVWNQSRTDQLDILREVADFFVRYLPGIKVYFAVGNHESAPVNSFPPPYVTGKNSISWLYSVMAETWIDKTNWLPKDTRSTIMQGGFYTTVIHPGLRVVSLNMNFCNDQNWWLQINETDPAGELQWLMNVLQQAEDKKEKVHILGHIPPGSCAKVWTANYYRIVDRYESTIVAQFFGHTHKDEFELFYDVDTLKRPTNVVYVGGSVTTYSQINPSYRVYTVDGNYSGSSWVVLDHATHILNITEANLTDKPKWQLEYTAKSAYGMESLLPSDWEKVVQEFKTNDAMFMKYYTYYYKSHVTGTCDDGCKASMICSCQSARGGDPSLCNIPAGLKYEERRLC